MLEAFDTNPTLSPAAVDRVVTPDDLMAARSAVESVHAAPELKEYILDIVAATRESADTRHGGSPRASLAFLNAGKARAAIRGRDYVIPDDVKALAGPILAHRLVLSTDAELSDMDARDVVEEVVGRVEPPGSEVDPEASVAVSDGGDTQESPD
jgi:MoxR-like ATPase